MASEEKQVEIGKVYSCKVGKSFQHVLIEKARRTPGSYLGKLMPEGTKVVRVAAAQLRGDGMTVDAYKEMLAKTPTEADAAPPLEAGATKTKKARSKKAAGEKPAKEKKAKEKKSKEPKERAIRHSLMNAALVVLGAAPAPMNTTDIVEAAEKSGLWVPGEGKTPQNTLYAAFMADEKNENGRKGRVQKAGRGVWELTEKGRAEIPAIKAALKK